MKKYMLLLAAVLALASVSVAVSVATAGNGAVVTKECPIASCNFSFWDGNDDGIAGALPDTTVTPTSYQDVLTPSGNENEVFKGTIANDTGHAVVYSPTSGAPIPADQTCYGFKTTHTTPDWQMTISASGNFTLTCHFGA